MQDIGHTVLVVHQLFEQAASRYPQHLAAMAGPEALTYAQLDAQASQLSAAIAQQAPAAAFIGLSTTRGLGMVVGVLAILKAGKAYLPLNPTYPAPRLARLAASAGLTHCVAPAAETDLFAGLGLALIEAENAAPLPAPGVPAVQGSAAYVLYTSGSTGEPKGVCMGHAPLVNLLRWQQENSEAGPGTRTLQFAPLSFDVSFQEIFATLGTGGMLVLLEEEQLLDFQELLRFIDAQQVNRLFLPFVALQALAEAAAASQAYPARLREVMTAGEQLKLTPALTAFFEALPGSVLFNQYGPTECHVVTQLRLAGPPAAWPALPTIGQPITNALVVILDENLTPLLDGEAGEIGLGGACLAEGYLNQPALTAEKFVPWPDPASPRLYRTGDLGRRLPDGSIEYLGRRAASAWRRADTSRAASAVGTR